MSTAIPSLTSKRQADHRSQRSRGSLSTVAHMSTGKSTGESLKLWTDYPGPPEENTPAYVGEHPQVWAKRKAAAAAEPKATVVDGKEQMEEDKLEEGELEEFEPEEDEHEEDELEEDELEEDELEENRVEVGEPCGEHKFVPIVFVQAMRTDKMADDKMAWWLEWELCAVSGWTNPTQFSQDCVELETRFWAHITKRQNKSKFDLARYTCAGNKLTVDRWWYEDEIAIDTVKHGEVPDTHPAKEPFAWPLRFVQHDAVTIRAASKGSPHEHGSFPPANHRESQGYQILKELHTRITTTLRQEENDPIRLNILRQQIFSSAMPILKAFISEEISAEWIVAGVDLFGRLALMLRDVASAAEGIERSLVKNPQLASIVQSGQRGQPEKIVREDSLREALASNHHIPLQTLSQALGIHRNTLRKHPACEFSVSGYGDPCGEWTALGSFFAVEKPCRGAINLSLGQVSGAETMNMGPLVSTRMPTMLGPDLMYWRNLEWVDMTVMGETVRMTMTTTKYWTYWVKLSKGTRERESYVYTHGQVVDTEDAPDPETQDVAPDAGHTQIVLDSDTEDDDPGPLFYYEAEEELVDTEAPMSAQDALTALVPAGAVTVQAALAFVASPFTPAAFEAGPSNPNLKPNAFFSLGLEETSYNP
ncbi:hypothetical protein PHLGIDRAFT_507613 [Phlebiopsis gigantea 11061_1 CR5-6]|uniref:Uncharacterized protein n=1 Tax=Phlebiopsis gigantea (strain 11061_1 CR5-6) TaxID=745531 RepID=A0A0C3RPD5_PHLG1|nr:hypothetical protein PHLGIDRAFT_507613 [Phlebiopsis gigantea 11061_1 CR5-6]